MQELCLTLRPLSPFAGQVRGDTLLGQACWTARRLHGEQRLASLLEGYTSGKPFAVFSDAFPSGFLPLPAIPLASYAEVDGEERKYIKKRRWLPREAIGKPLAAWLAHARRDDEALENREAMQPHNSINRRTGTTGEAGFAPFSQPRSWYGPGSTLDCYVIHDPDRISSGELLELLETIGKTGYGRDASTGMGKFTVETRDDPWPMQDAPDAWLTLAPCVPQGGNFDASRSCYRPFTRFGRHGDMAVHGQNPFKAPVLLADTGALLTPKAFHDTRFTGTGLGGNGELSSNIPATVHQGYTPVIPVNTREVSL
jgi:CRISPR-associated protein Csm4